MSELTGLANGERDGIPQHYVAPALQIPDRSQYTILVVEDNPEVMDMLVGYLQRRGHRVLTAANTRDANDIVQGHMSRSDASTGVAETLDVILSDRDLGMGHTPGDEFLLSIRNEVAAYLILMSGDDMYQKEENRQHLAANGIMYLQKGEIDFGAQLDYLLRNEVPKHFAQIERFRPDIPQLPALQPPAKYTN